ncbi:hypothetical protein RJ640_009327 [Escallonia rubra]|uniref:Alcohol dehydrogenase n=1 Tax=Escallonia rubra TaxID=112253 RepID=A0AA88RGR2_9ASTE|nr:hypothetical protein RJ640_009327 [Escallonia rubra]
MKFALAFGNYGHIEVIPLVATKFDNCECILLYVLEAAVVWKSGEQVKLEEIQVDPPKATEVRIKMICASLCHTDISVCNGFPLFFMNPRNTSYNETHIHFILSTLHQPLFPRIPGHEGVGTIESVGENVTEVKEGDVVMPLYLGECGECLNCKSGKTNLCLTYPIRFNGLMPDGTSRMSIGGEKIYHHFNCSTWSEYIVIDSNYVVKVDPRMELPHASFLACGFTTGYGAAWKEVDVKKDSTVAVLGLGAVGLGVLEGARMRGAARIIGVDLNDMKREKGDAFGMTEFINPADSKGKSVSDLLKEVTGGLGVDYCFECTGVVSMFDEAVEASKMVSIFCTSDFIGTLYIKGLGTVVLIGANQSSGVVKFIPLLLGRTVKGSIYGGVRPQSDIPTIIDKCINRVLSSFNLFTFREIQLDELLTHKVSFHEIDKAFAHFKQPDCVKVLIKF